MNRAAVRTAIPIAVLAAGASVLGGIALNRVLDDTPRPDGEFVLDEPGIYEEPVDGENPELAGRGLPRIELLDVDDQPTTLADLNAELGNKPMVINVWYSTCPPCARELADFADVERELGDRVQFVGVNPFDSVPVMTRFAGERGVEYPLLRDADNLFVVGLEVVAYPVTLFVDADGVIVGQTGAVDAAELRAKIDELL